MRTTGLKGRDYLAETDFSREEIETILEAAADLKRERAQGTVHDHLLRARTLFMIFYNRSLRTRNSFEAAMTQMGGHAHYLDPERIYSPAMPGKEEAFATERVSDVARVLARMGEGIAIRCFGDRVNWEYGAAHAMLQEFARWSDVPVLNMEDDVLHPFQGLADMLTIRERFGAFKGVRLAMSWAYSPSVSKPRAVPQSAILYATQLGMDVTLSHPEGMDLDPEIIARARANSEANDGKFTIVHDFRAGIEGAHAVYPKAWAAAVLFQPPVGQGDKKAAQALFDRHKDWKCTEGLMALAHERAIYLHCLPADRGFEATDEVMDKTTGPGWTSAIFDQAENRLHVQKAVLCLVL